MVLAISSIAGPDSALISTGYKKITIDRMGVAPVPGGRGFSESAVFAGGEFLLIRGLPTGTMRREDAANLTSPTSVMLHSQVFEVLPRERYNTGIQVFVLQPFDMTQIDRWLKGGRAGAK